MNSPCKEAGWEASVTSALLFLTGYSSRRVQSPSSKSNDTLSGISSIEPSKHSGSSHSLASVRVPGCLSMALGLRLCPPGAYGLKGRWEKRFHPFIHLFTHSSIREGFLRSLVTSVCRALVRDR